MELILKIFLFILITAGSVGCNQSKREIVYSEPVFPIDTKVEFEMILEDPVMPHVLLDIDFYNGKLVLMYLMDNRFIHLFDAETGEELGNALNRGQGPGEILEAANFWLDRETGTLSVFDYMSKKLFSGNIDSLYRGVNLSSLNDDFGMAIAVFPLPRGYLIFEPPIINDPKKRYCMKKWDGEVVRYEGYPHDDFKLVQKIFISTHEMGFSKDGTKMVAAASPGLIMEIFDLKNGIEKTHTRYFRKILFGSDGNPSYTKSGAGITDFYCSDKYIYATFGEPEPNSDDTRYNNIAVFDWEGNPMKIFRTNYRRLKKICLDDEERFLYILGEDEDWIRFIAKLDLTQY